MEQPDRRARRQALIEALREKQIAGAELDDFDEEPLSTDDPLRFLENVVLTPRLGYVVRERLQLQFYSETTENVLGLSQRHADSPS
jgi:D-3-phosphoglycerate dehydrogenase